MKQAIALVVFMLTMSVWTVAQQPEPSGGQATPPSSQTPGAGQSQPPAPGPGDQASPQPRTAPGDTSAAGDQPIIEGCLGGASPNFTLTDKAGTTYKLNFPANANVSSLEPHVGETVRVMGPVKSSSIDVSRIGKGSGTCPGSAPKKK